MVKGGRGIRARESQAPFQILSCDDNGIISTATGFFYEHGGRKYLITNWHVVSGKDFLTGELLEQRRPPTFIKIKLATTFEPVGAYTMVAREVSIYNGNDPAKNPLWYEHPIYGHLCDVVAIPFDDVAKIPPNLHAPVNLIHKAKIPVKPGVGVFILGYPRTLSIHIGWPLWKSGYIASEPFYDVTIGGKLSEIGGMKGGLTLPAFFVDARTREGMSGAPVFANFIGNWDMTDPYRAVDPTEPNFLSRDDVAIGENRLEFVGAYSSRLPKLEAEADLGLCFKRDAIAEICEARSIGRHPQFQ